MHALSTAAVATRKPLALTPIARSLGLAFILAVPAYASASVFSAGDIVVSGSFYSGTASSVTVGQALPGGGNAIADGSYPNVFANDTVDGSFGITSPVFLNVLTPTGSLVNTINIPTIDGVTSFSSKSELALNLTQDGTGLTFMDYAAPVNTLDVSNSNTPGVNDPTNPVASSYSRNVVQINNNGTIQTTATNTYSGNNGRAVIQYNGSYITVGNAGNGSGSPANIAADTGVQLVTPGTGASTKIGNYNITQNGYAADKTAKDNNFRGETIFNNTLYVTKGSGSNGIDTVYQVGATGSVPNASDAATAAITVLPGFPTGLAKTNTANFYPFGLYFANATTLYVADEGSGSATGAATDANAGLEKWSDVNGTWHYDYTLQAGLNLGQQYTVAGYPTNLDPATDGLRNIAGQNNSDGTVTLYAITSTISASGDQGGDPNKLVSITDTLADTTSAQAAGEQFTTLQTASFGEVLRGVAISPVPEPETYALLAVGLGLAGFMARRRKQ